MSDGDSFETCPTDIAHAPAERVWELLINPSRFQWVDAKVVAAPARLARVGDQVVFAASLGLRVTWTVLALQPPHQLSLDIGLPFGMRNQETIVLSPLGADSCRITFN